MQPLTDPISAAVLGAWLLLPLLALARLVLRRLQAYSAWRAREEAAQELRRRQLSRVRNRFVAALEIDADTQQWIPAASVKSVEELTAPRTRAVAKSVLASQPWDVHQPQQTEQQQLLLLPYSTPFPASMVWGESGCVACLSFRRDFDEPEPEVQLSSAAHSNMVTTGADEEAAAAATPARAAEALQQDDISEEETERLLSFSDAYDDEDERELRLLAYDAEEEERVRKEYERFAQQSKMTRIPRTKHWDVTQLQKEPPLPKVYKL